MRLTVTGCSDGLQPPPILESNYVRRLCLVKSEHSEEMDTHTQNEYKIIPSRPSELEIRRTEFQILNPIAPSCGTKGNSLGAAPYNSAI